MLSTLSQLKTKRDVIKKKRFAIEIADVLVNIIDLERPKHAVGLLPCLWLLIIVIECGLCFLLQKVGQSMGLTCKLNHNTHFQNL
jgi:hypothetical protein